ncbi:unnamed protein product [Hermetia illucens]|uniref:Uncharacterized protein n=1 Tax=Hermetia illucens TaxID=343691 RepID=A0A7R8V8F3_HERIL|nr:uncharacterized protein DDB_G0271670 isoform X2 [Hermetia illucens]CAD7094017.1 unnamed protein product [Hermetia illucens]
MASVKDTASFFAYGNSKQFDYCLKLYPEVLKLKAEKRCKKPEELIRLDDWYQNELPRRIKQRGKDAHMVHEELVQTMKWKQSRGKFYPQLSYLVKVNTPRAVMQETKKAFRKLPNLEQAITALSNLKGVGTTMASALLAAAAPDSAPFMADECLMAIPEIEGIDYTTKEYLNFVQHIQSTVERLNSEKDSVTSWSPHRVELALWTHFVASDLKPELLENLPPGSHHPALGFGGGTGTINNSTTNGVNDADQDDYGDVPANTLTPPPTNDSTITAANVNNDAETEATQNTNSSSSSSSTTSSSSSLSPKSNSANRTVTSTSTTTSSGVATATDSLPLEISDESNLEPPASNGALDSLDESTRSEDSLEKPATPATIANDETIDSDSVSSTKRSLDCDSYEDPNECSQPEMKKVRSN